MSHAYPGSVAGTTLPEILIVLIIIGLLATAAVPRFAVAGEQTRVDMAGAGLHSIWVAQRMYWMENRQYAGALNDLTDMYLIESTLPAQSTPFSFSITSADETTFLAEADRSGSTDWSGSIAIDEDGDLSGSVNNGEGRSVTPIAP